MKRKEWHWDVEKGRWEERPDFPNELAGRRSQAIKHSTEKKQEKHWRERILTTIQTIVFVPLFVIMAVFFGAFVCGFLYLVITDNMQEFMAAVGGTILGMMVHYLGWIGAIMLCGLFVLCILAADAKNK